MARSILLMPGPLSANVSRMPLSLPFETISILIFPPSAYLSILRTSSLAAVMSLVWLTSPILILTAYSRTLFRNGTTSCSLTTAISSLDRDMIIFGDFFIPAIGRNHRLQQSHSFFHVQGCPNAIQRKSELYQGDRYGGLHANHHRLRIEYSRHAGDIAKDPSHEGINDIDGGNIDQHAFGSDLVDHLDQVRLQVKRQAVIEV